MKSTSKKLISLTLALVMLFSLFGINAYALKDSCGYKAASTTSALLDSGENGVVGYAYKIASRTDLLSFITYVNSGKATEGITFYLSCDVTMTDTTVVPIGITAEKAFRGTFDGCGFAVLDYTIESTSSYQALFGYVSGEKAIIKNLGVQGNITGMNCVAGIAAQLTGATIANCWSSVNVKGASFVGGIVGVMNGGTLANSCNYGSVKSGSTSEDETGNNYCIGAIAAKISDGAVIDHAYYVYYSADFALGSKTADCTKEIYRFASASTECLTEKELTIKVKATDNLITLLNEWIDEQINSNEYYNWVYDTSESSRLRTNGRFPAQEYPGYIAPSDSVYKETSSMSALHEQMVDGVSGGYYSINSVAELFYFEEYVNNGYATEGITFYLTHDLLVASGISTVDQINWTPIGYNDKTPFRGVFDGQGYIIKGFMITSGENLGLFGYVDSSNAIIKNVGVRVAFSGTDYVGGICGRLINGSIYNSWVAGTVSGENRVGGIASYSENGVIINCVCYADVTGTHRVGGIVGGSESKTKVSYCYYNDSIANGTGEENGTLSVIIPYSVEKVQPEDTEDLAEQLEETYEFTLSRSIVIGSHGTMKLLNALNYWVSDLGVDASMRYWKIDDSAEGVSRSAGNYPVHLYPNDNKGIKYIDEPLEELMNTGNPFNVNYTETATMTALYEADIDGIQGGHYSISSGEELEMLATYVNNGHVSKGLIFYLTGDINVIYQCADQGADGWTPIGRDSKLTDPNTYFRSFQGVFDGCGYTISGLTITKNEEDNVGLFGKINDATVKNLGITGGIVAEFNCGGIAGKADGTTFTNCWTAVSIQSESETGGIVGKADDCTIENCVAYGAMLCYGGETADAGGIVGDALGNCVFKNCFYLADTTPQPYNSISNNTTAEIVGFSYIFNGDEYICSLERSVIVEDIVTTDLLTALNAWVYADNTGLYSAWQNSAVLISNGDTLGHYPTLMSPDPDAVGTGDAYDGNYTATSTMTQLYNTRLDGVKNACYSINGIVDLESLQKYVAAGFETKDIVFFMTRDIDMSGIYCAETGKSWNPIGSVEHPFQGTFDGEGYTVKYIYINSTTDDVGLFGHVNDGAVIKNLGIGGGIVRGEVNCGSIVGDFNFAQIINCWASAEVVAIENNGGGIVGGANMGSIINTTYYGLVANGKRFGAIAGYAVGTIMQYCYYLYTTTQKAYGEGSAPVCTAVYHFNGTSAVCVLEDEVNINGSTTKNALAALKLYVDSNPNKNLCYWTSGNTAEYAKMGVTMFPVLISSSGTMGETSFMTVQAYFNDTEYYSLNAAVVAANDTPGGGEVKLATNIVLTGNNTVTLDDDVSINTGDYTFLTKTAVYMNYMRQIQGTFIVKEGGHIDIYDAESATYKPYFYAKKNADPSCNSAFYGTDSLTVQSAPVNSENLYAYDLTFHDGDFYVNSTLDSGMPHKIPAGSVITLESQATLTVLPNARIRTTGGAEIYNNSTVKIGNVTLDRNKGIRMVGIFEDDNGTVTLPYIYWGGHYLRGWTNKETGELYEAGSKVNADTAITLTATWGLGDKDDPYPGDDTFNDDDEPNYNIPITVIQSEGGTLTPETIYAARGENITVNVNPTSNGQTQSYEGYYIKNVLVDGKSVKLDNNNYQFVSVSEPHSIIALFALQTNTAYHADLNIFFDVPFYHTFHDDIHFVKTMGICNGKTATQFCPDDPTTRAQFVTFLWNLSGKPVMPDSVKCSFTDVPKSSYFYNAVRWASYFGIVNGYDEITFGSYDNITRQALVAMLFRYAKNYAGDDISQYDGTNILGYSDVLSLGKGMSQAFQWAIGAGIVSGTTDNRLNPTGYALRSHVAAFLARYCNKFVLLVPVVDFENIKGGEDIGEIIEDLPDDITGELPEGSQDAAGEIAENIPSDITDSDITDVIADTDVKGGVEDIINNFNS